MPSSAFMVAETFRRLNYVPGAMQPAEVLTHFNHLLRNLFEETLHTLNGYEEQVFAQGIPREFMKTYPNEVKTAEVAAQKRGFNEGVAHLLTAWYPRLRRAFLSVSQGRMARGGRDFELEIEGLLTLAHVPFDRQVKGKGREEHTDFILPNFTVHQGNRTISMIISAKRTLRERWAEVAEELMSTRSPNVFLFTADEDVTIKHVEQIKDYNIYLVVWDHVKIDKFSEEPMVLGYTEWATQRLRILRQNWL